MKDKYNLFARYLMASSFITNESLATLTYEVEAILNSRPLTFTSIDPDDLEPLTPNHLLLLKPPSLFLPIVFDERDLHSRKLWCHSGPDGLRNTS